MLIISNVLLNDLKKKKDFCVSVVHVVYSYQNVHIFGYFRSDYVKIGQNQFIWNALKIIDRL